MKLMQKNRLIVLPTYNNHDAGQSGQVTSEVEFSTRVGTIVDQKQTKKVKQAGLVHDIKSQ